MARRTRVQIDCEALRENLRRLMKINGTSFFCPMIKANAYGHGVGIVSRVLQEMGIQAAGVALYEEAAEIRDLGFDFPLLVFGPTSNEDAKLAAKLRVTPVVGRFEDLEALESAGFKGEVHLKFNTGMHRLGFDETDLPSLKSKSFSFRVAGVCTHFTHGEDAGDENGPTALQVQRFLTMAKDFPGVRHAHKSATLATMTGLKNRHPEIGARPGISVYGLPYEGRATGPGLQPVLRWVSELVDLHTVERGESVSYSARWTAERRSIVGVVAVGYGDGYARSLSNQGEMLFRGQKVPVIGSVCMDYTLVDLTDACAGQDARLGEEVVMIGRQGTAEIAAADLAEKMNTTVYEVVAGIGPRVRREEK